MGFLSLLGLMVTGGIALSGTARNTMSDDREKAKQRELGIHYILRSSAYS